MSKDQLKKELVALQLQLDDAKTIDEDIRLEFAKAFNWTRKKSNYSDEREIVDASWSQIFVEIGRLLSKSDRGDMISQLLADVQFLKERDDALTRLTGE